MCKCKKLLQDYANWCMVLTDKYHTNYLEFILVSHDPAWNQGQLVTFSRGTLGIDASKTLLTTENGGVATQLFSDRGSPQPFIVSAPTKLNLSVVIETGRITVKSATYTNDQAVADMRCANGVLYGFYGPGGGASASGAVSLSILKKVQQNIF